MHFKLFGQFGMADTLRIEFEEWCLNDIRMLQLPNRDKLLLSLCRAIIQRHQRWAHNGEHWNGDSDSCPYHNCAVLHSTREMPKTPRILRQCIIETPRLRFLSDENVTHFPDTFSLLPDQSNVIHTSSQQLHIGEMFQMDYCCLYLRPKC